MKRSRKAGLRGELRIERYLRERQFARCQFRHRVLQPNAAYIRCGEIPMASVNPLVDSPADFRAGQGAPTRQKCERGTGEEAQRRPARKDAAQRATD
jgi:hypothetical protein